MKSIFLYLLIAANLFAIAVFLVTTDGYRDIQSSKYFEKALEVLRLRSPAQAVMYRWVDSSGQIGFGSVPPKGASSVVPITEANISKYSSSTAEKNLGQQK